MKLLDAVVLTADVPEHGLLAGDVGAVVEVYTSRAVEVEFVAPGGRTRALLTLDTRMLRKLRSTDIRTVRESARP